MVKRITAMNCYHAEKALIFCDKLGVPASYEITSGRYIVTMHGEKWQFDQVRNYLKRLS